MLKVRSLAKRIHTINTRMDNLSDLACLVHTLQRRSWNTLVDTELGHIPVQRVLVWTWVVEQYRHAQTTSAKGSAVEENDTHRCFANDV